MQYVLLAAVNLAVTLTVAVSSGAEPMILWYDRPAEVWTEALPVGNGRLGAMVFGGQENERIQFNDDTLWTGKPRDYSHPGAAAHLPEIRKLLFEGKQKEAEQLASEHFMSVPLRQFAYQPFGDLRLELTGHDGATGYRRQLDLDTAVARVDYRVGQVTYTREVFSSAPDQVIVVRITADRPGSVAFAARLETPHPDAGTTALGTTGLVLRGQLGRFYHERMKQEFQSVLKYEARLSVSADGGRVQATDEGVEVTGADSATLVLAAATSHRGFRDTGADPAARCDEAMNKAGGKDYAELLRAHVEDHQRLFRRVKLDVGTTDAAKLSTDQRVKAFADGNDPALAALYFQFGRYLLIAGSRPGSQPVNLQGIWNEKTVPPWDSKWTTNINTGMNYWPAETCNLSECHGPLFDMLDEVVISGRRTAKVHYDCRGWVLHHNIDLWRGTAPINASNHGIWPTGGAWLCQHLWEHYLFTGDRQFLAERAYPVIKEASLFFVDFLIDDPRSGRLISTPSNSPEQGGLVAGPTMDHQIIRDLLGNCIEAAGILGVDAKLSEELRDVRARIAPNQIGQYGQLQEWLEDVDNPKNQHRHLSHLWGFQPGCEITVRGTPKLADAVRQSLEFRGNGSTGWSMAWKVNLWARLLDGDRALLMLTQLISKSTQPNLFNSHASFQIDGNFGGTAGVAEMLLQSHAGEVAILPAWPKDAWPTGRVEGLRARGGLEVDVAWQNGLATSAVLRAALDGSHRIRPPAGHKVTEIRCGTKSLPLKTNSDGLVLVAVKAGEDYRIDFKKTVDN